MIIEKTNLMKKTKLNFLLTVVVAVMTALSLNAQNCDVAVGTLGFPSDPACEAAICAADGFCCSVSWDGICAGAAAAEPACCGCLTVPMCAGDCVTLQCPGGSTAPCATYVIDAGVAFNYVDISGTSTQTLNGDDAFGTFTLDAPWGMYGITYTALGVSTNGFITASASQSDLSNDCPINPAFGDDQDRIYVLHDDLDMEPGEGSIHYQYFGASPYAHPSGVAYGAHIFQWKGDHFPGAVNGVFDVDAQAILFDNGDIILQYNADTEGGTGSTVGISTGDASIAPCAPSTTQYQCNTGGTTTAGTAVGFSPYGGPLSTSPAPGQGLSFPADPGLCTADVDVGVTAIVTCTGGQTITSYTYALTGATVGNGNYTEGGTITMNVGTTIVTIMITDSDGANYSCQFDVEVVDDQPPVITGCNDVIRDLGPGECSAQVSWNVQALDNCEEFLPIEFGTQTTFNNNNQFAGNMFDLTNTGTEAYAISRFDLNMLAGSHTIDVYRTTSPGTFLGNETNGVAGGSNANWTYVSTTAVTGAGAGNPTNCPITPFTILPGQTFGVYVIQTNGSSMLYTNGATNYDEYSTAALRFNGGNGWGGPPFTGPVFSPRTFNGNIYYTFGEFSQSTVLTQTAGPMSGSQFEGGTSTTVSYTATDLAGLTANCSFEVIVNEYSGPVSGSLACNDDVQISVDENCEALVQPDDILEGGPYRCYDTYEVTVEGYGTGLGGVLIDDDAVGEWLGVTVTDPETGNSCWGQIHVEDKIDPVLECVDVTVNCGDNTDPVFAPPLSGTVSNTVSPGLPIGPDGGTITNSSLTLSAPQGARATDVNMFLNIEHTWTADVFITLTSPSGQQATFNVPGCTGNFPINCTIDDEGTPITLCTELNAGGAAVSAMGLADMFPLDGSDVTGTWDMEIIDLVSLDGGTLNAWGLTVAYTQELPFAPTVTENCGGATLDYNDVESGDDCEGGAILRTWTATDASGNTGTCLQTITVNPLTLDGLVCPDNWTGECGGSTSPAVTGYPTINGTPVVLGGTCNIFAGYDDLELADCGNGTKIVRTWTILDWCTQETAQCIQVIKLTDNQGPVLDCPDDITVSADPWFCEADVNIDYPDAYDACGTSFTWSVSSSAGTIVPFGSFYRVDDLPLGTHTITWTAEDACGNSSTCFYTITVEDDIPPVPLCDEHTIVSLTNDDLLNQGLTKIPATVFDDGSYDNCGEVTFLARRMTSCINFDWIGPAPLYGEFPNSDGIVTSLDRGQTPRALVPFACCDVAAGPIMIELTVFDEAGNRNTCMVEVEVQDKLSPFIECPPDIIVSCDFWFDVAATNGFVPQSEDVTSPIFGRVLDAYDYDESDRQPIIWIDDPGNDELAQPYLWGYDGWADDNCDVDVTVRVRLFDDCSGDAFQEYHQVHTRRVLVSVRSEQEMDKTTAALAYSASGLLTFDPFYISDQTCVNSDPNDGVIWPCDETYYHMS